MDLSLLVASRGLSVHYAAPAAHVRQARSRVHGWDPKTLASVHFHDLNISTYESPAPDPTAPLSATHRRVVVVYDNINTFAAVEAARLGNGEAYGLQCVAMSYNIAWLGDGPGHQLLRDHSLQFLPFDAPMSKEFMEYMFRATAEAREGGGVARAGLVINTCRVLEGEFIDAVAEHAEFKGQKLFPVGPLNPLLDASARTPGKTRHECMDWLDAQPPASVLYVSFGTTSSFRGEQIAELAAALKGSKQRFIWVLRDADRADIFAESGESGHGKLLSSEFTKEIEGTGLVITGWAPQLEILAHGATAAFMSHCGWNSTLESLSHGKPMLAWPMHSDQPWDAELLCKYLRVALLVRPWEKHSEVVPADDIQKVIEEAMVSENRMAVRQRAKVLGDAIRASMAEGGSSRKGLDDFVAYITR
ncbi:unnamed protein product [Alopecurus aequalis]